MRVLYVEDNPANVFLVKRVAKIGQHEIINYIDGGQALKKFDDINPDLILMDIQLAGDIGGLDVVRELRGRGVNVPIIAVTAYAMVGDKERCLAAGCDDYLAKPLPVPRLVEIFQEYSDKVTSTVLKTENTVDETAPSEEKSEPTLENKADETVVSASKTETTETTAETVSSTATAESPAPESPQDAKQAPSDKIEPDAKEAPSDAIAEDAKQTPSDKIEPDAKEESSTQTETLAVNNGAEAEQNQEASTGKLSDEDTLPVNEEQESEMPKSTSEPSSNT